MSKIFLINVGANTSHSSLARSPIFGDNTFIYIPFPHRDEREAKPYPIAARPFVNNVDTYETHSDPDWENLSYGDYCANARATALRQASYEDILLFWALLWRNNGKTWKTFTGKKGWYLIGALRIDEILKEGQKPQDATASNVQTAAQNAHFLNGRGVLEPHNFVFIGSKSHSCLFPKAVEFLVDESESDLLFRTVRTAKGALLAPNGKPHWSSATRTCRAVWNLDSAEQRSRAELVREAIFQKTGFDLVAKTGLIDRSRRGGDSGREIKGMRGSYTPSAGVAITERKGLKQPTLGSSNCLFLRRWRSFGVRS